MRFSLRVLVIALIALATIMGSNPPGRAAQPDPQVAAPSASSSPEQADPVVLVVDVLIEHSPHPASTNAFEGVKGRWIGCRAEGTGMARCAVFALTGI